MAGHHQLKILFVINPSSGANNTNWQELISNYFTEKSFDVQYHNLGKKPDINAIKKILNTFVPDKVVAVGGDGTVTMVAKLIAGSNAALGIIPGGSANGMAKELDIPEDAEAALDIIVHGQVSNCDAIKLNNREVCLHLADVGLNAQFIKYFDEGNLRGKLGYAKVFLKTLWHSQKLSVQIMADNVKINTHAFMVVLANASKYGTGAVINPQGKIDDGKFEIVIVRKLSFVEILKTVFRPDSLDPEKIEVISVSQVTIQAKRNAHFQVDGEYMGKLRKVDARILPDYLKVILPKQKPV